MGAFVRLLVRRLCSAASSGGRRGFAHGATRASPEAPDQRMDGQSARGHPSLEELGSRWDHHRRSRPRLEGAREVYVIPYEWIGEAQARIAAHVEKTPLTFDEKRGLYLKWENRQVTGSFKPRGAINKVLALEDWERRAGLVAASAGNHGQGVALGGRITKALVEVFVSEHAVPAKVQAMRELGA